MTIFTARQLLPVSRRSNWDEPHLTYLPRACYMPRGFGSVRRRIARLFRRGRHHD